MAQRIRKPPTNGNQRMRKRHVAISMASVLVLTTVVYLPVLRGEFVWDDEYDFVAKTWLTEGDAWKHYIFRDFHGWTNYFRPLVVALFTIQLRLFDVQPGPMHAVSLAAHLVNTMLVGLLALRAGAAVGRPSHRMFLPAILSMLLFGLHPALIEPVAWIACQFDLFSTLFMLLGLLASAGIRRQSTRALAVATCFFLAACCKESAAAFPLMLVVFDWALQTKRENGPVRPPAIRDFISGNIATYAAVFIAGCLYLVFRSWALGQIVPAEQGSLPLLSRFQTSSFLYLRYWLMVFMPALDMNPLHPFDSEAFRNGTAMSILTDVAVIGLVGLVLWISVRRGAAWACITLALSVSLLPVLRVMPAYFDAELYHERYLMLGLALACAMLPLLRIDFLRAHRLRNAMILIGVAWTLASVVTIRSTLPHWRNSVALWEWAYSENPHYLMAVYTLHNTYVRHGMYDQDYRLGNRSTADGVRCTHCMLDIAYIAALSGNSDRAIWALSEAEQDMREIARQRPLSDEDARELQLMTDKYTAATKLLHARTPQPATDASPPSSG